MDATVKCEKGARDATVTHREVSYRKVNQSINGYVRVPEFVQFKIDCPHCGRYVRLKNLGTVRRWPPGR